MPQNVASLCPQRPQFILHNSREFVAQHMCPPPKDNCIVDINDVHEENMMAALGTNLNEYCSANRHHLSVYVTSGNIMPMNSQSRNHKC